MDTWLLIIDIVWGIGLLILYPIVIKLLIESIKEKKMYK